MASAALAVLQAEAIQTHQELQVGRLKEASAAAEEHLHMEPVPAMALTARLNLGRDLHPQVQAAKQPSITHEDTKMSGTAGYHGMERRVTPRRENDTGMASAERVEMELQNHIDICAIRYEGIEKQFIGVNARLKRIEISAWKGMAVIITILFGGMGTILWAILRSAHGGL